MEAGEEVFGAFSFSFLRACGDAVGGYHEQIPLALSHLFHSFGDLHHTAWLKCPLSQQDQAVLVPVPIQLLGEVNVEQGLGERARCCLFNERSRHLIDVGAWFLVRVWVGALGMSI